MRRITYAFPISKLPYSAIVEGFFLRHSGNVNAKSAESLRSDELNTIESVEGVNRAFMEDE